MTDAAARALVRRFTTAPEESFFDSYDQAVEMTRKVCAHAKTAPPPFPPLTVRALITYVKDHAA